MRISEREIALVANDYSVAQYVEELEFAQMLAPAQRGAMLTAAKKRMKAHIISKRRLSTVLSAVTV